MDKSLKKRGLFVAALTAVLLLATLVHVVLLQWESRREEQHMLRTHGEVYRTYCQTVGRFVTGIEVARDRISASALSCAGARCWQ